MTTKQIEVYKNLLESQFDVSETMKVLTHNLTIYWSWGVSNKFNLIDKGLVLKVNGHHHKGYVLITLGYDDTYSVHIISTHGNVLNTYRGVYFDMLVDVIDNRIERIKDYSF